MAPEFVKSGRYPRKGWFRKLNELTMKTYSEEFRNLAGMLEFKDRAIGSSSGTANNVIARMCLLQIRCLVLDEPTTGWMRFYQRVPFMSWCITVRITIKNSFWWLRMTLKRLTSYLVLRSELSLESFNVHGYRAGGDHAWFIPVWFYATGLVGLWLLWSLFFSCTRDFLDFKTAESGWVIRWVTFLLRCRFKLFLGISPTLRLWSLSL